MVKAESTVTIEVDGKNRNLLFPPLRRRIRGRFDVARMPEPGRLRTEWAEPIPGQLLALNPATGAAALVEPLRGAEHAGLREKIERRGLRIAEEREDLGPVHVPTWLHFMRLAVDAGMARVVSGELPERNEIEGEPQMDYVTRRQPSPIDRLTAAIERQTAALEKLLSART